MTALTIYADLGGSGSKGIYWNPRQRQPQVIWMEPQVALMNPEHAGLLDADGQLGAKEPEQSAYVQIGADFYAVGTLGRIYQGDSGLVFPKKDNAVVKLIAMVGTIWEKIVQPYQYQYDVELDLGVLLPLEEYWRDRVVLEQNIKKALAGCSFRGKSLAFKVGRISLLPEGAGGYLFHNMSLLSAGRNLKDSTVVILMFGHRNLSVLTFDCGNLPQPTNSASDGPGYIKYLEQCSSNLPGVSSDNPYLFDAILNGESEFRVRGREEVFDLGVVGRIAKQIYLDAVKKFLKTKLPDSARYRLLVMGGAASGIRPQLEEYFSGLSLIENLDWSCELDEELHQNLHHSDGSSIDSSLERVRLADGYGAFSWFAASKPTTQLR